MLLFHIKLQYACEKCVSSIMISTSIDMSILAYKRGLFCVYKAKKNPGILHRFYHVCTTKEEPRD